MVECTAWKLMRMMRADGTLGTEPKKVWMLARLAAKPELLCS